MKATITWQRSDEERRNVRHPLLNAPASGTARLLEALTKRAFAMPGL
jgi:hypothetical protein